MENPILIPISIIIVLLAIWIPDRIRISRNLRSVSSQHRELEAALNGFVEEFEKIAVELSRLVLVQQPAPPVTVFQRRSEILEQETVESGGTGVERRHLVVGLAQRGRSVSQIAGALMIPSGEVALILNLSQESGSAASRALERRLS